MITQSQIAKMAGVSRATVGRVINNYSDVNEETRKKVLAIIEKTEYTPNRAGKALVIQQKNIRIGCIIIDANNPFYQELNRGIQEKAEEFQTYGIEVIVKKAHFTAEDQIKKIEELMSLGISALVIQPTVEEPMATKLRDIEHAGIPVVTVNTEIPEYQSNFCYVGNDFYMCGKTAANLIALITNGSCRIGLINGFNKAKSHYDRIEGFKDFIADYPNMQIIDYAENKDDEMESYHITRTMLKQHPEIDTIFIVAGGVYGSGCAIKTVMAETGRQIRVFSFDDVPTTKELVREGIIQATICQQPVRQGRMALSVLFDYFVDGKTPVQNRLYTDIQIKIKANIE